MIIQYGVENIKKEMPKKELPQTTEKVIIKPLGCSIYRQIPEEIRSEMKRINTEYEQDMAEIQSCFILKNPGIRRAKLMIESLSEKCEKITKLKKSLETPPKNDTSELTDYILKMNYDLNVYFRFYKKIKDTLNIFTLEEFNQYKTFFFKIKAIQKEYDTEKIYEILYESPECVRLAIIQEEYVVSKNNDIKPVINENQTIEQQINDLEEKYRSIIKEEKITLEELLQVKRIIYKTLILIQKYCNNKEMCNKQILKSSKEILEDTYKEKLDEKIKKFKKEKEEEENILEQTQLKLLKTCHSENPITIRDWYLQTSILKQSKQEENTNKQI